MRNILKWYHEIIAISVTLSAWTGWAATYTNFPWESYTLSSLPIWAEIVLDNWDYLIYYDELPIWEIVTIPSSGYNIDSMVVDRGWTQTTVSSTPITLQDWDAIYVTFKSAELLLARNPIQWYEMVWDWVDSIWFKFQNVYTYDSSYQTHYYSWEIWISDTDYWMPSYNYLSPLPPELVTSDEVKTAMMYNRWDNLYIPWNTTAQSIYSNSSWGWINLGNYDWTPSPDWYDMHFVNTLEWQIICQMFSYSNQWETPDWTSLGGIAWVQIPWTLVYSNPYSLVRWDANTWNTGLSSDRLYYIPWDYYNNRSSSSFRAVALGSSQWYLPSFGAAQLYITGMSVETNLWKMRVLNTSKTNYSEDL